MPENLPKSSSKKKVLVAMSGGVDSSVAAALLVDQGYEVIGATMQVWDYSSCDIQEGNGTCCSSLDVDDARAVADKLGIPFYVLNCEEKFKTSVVEPFLKAYLEGQTPLPCVNCNTYLKFDHLIRKMKELDCAFLATGHYAQVLKNPEGQIQILTSADEWKDQTYFLFTLDKSILPHLLFPIGHLTKTQVRSYAISKNLSVAKKKDSVGICFVGHKGYDHFIESQVPLNILKEKCGWIRRFPSGEFMAKHEGIHHYTYGQSKGLGMDHHEKLFVLKIDPKDNTVWVGDENFLFTSEVNAIKPHLLDEFIDGELVKVKIRYAGKGAAARIFRRSQGLHFEFLEPQRAVTPGQAAVIYRDVVHKENQEESPLRQLVGGAWITL